MQEFHAYRKFACKHTTEYPAEKLVIFYFENILRIELYAESERDIKFHGVGVYFFTHVFTPTVKKHCFAAFPHL